MSISILKTHYRRGANILTPEQIEEIRHLKNKVLAYMIVKEYHINKIGFMIYGTIVSIFSKMETIPKKKKIIIQFQDL